MGWSTPAGEGWERMQPRAKSEASALMGSSEGRIDREGSSEGRIMKNELAIEVGKTQK